MKTYTLRSTGEVVTSKDGEWPTQYANRTQAQQAAEKVSGEVIQRGRPFYVRVGIVVSTAGKTIYPETRRQE